MLTLSKNSHLKESSYSQTIPGDAKDTVKSLRDALKELIS